MQKEITRIGRADGPRQGVTAFLAELSQAACLLGQYPPAHPLIPATIRSVRESLDRLLGDRQALLLSMDEGTLTHEGRAVEWEGAGAAAFVSALERAGVEVVELSREAGDPEIGGFLRWLQAIGVPAGMGSSRVGGHDRGGVVAPGTDLQDPGGGGALLPILRLRGITVRLRSRGTTATGPSGEDMPWKPGRDTGAPGVGGSRDYAECVPELPGSDRERVRTGHPSPAAEDMLRRGVSHVAAQLLLEREEFEDADEVLVQAIASRAVAMLEEGRFEECRQPLAAIRFVSRNAPDGSPVRTAADSFLRDLSAGEVVGRLIGSVDDCPPGRTAALVEVFASTGAEGVRAIMLSFSNMPPGEARERRVQLLAEFDPEAIRDGFARLLSEETIEIVCGALPALRRVPLREANILVQGLVSHPDPRIRLEALKVLVMVDRRDGAFDRHLERALRDTDESVRAAAIGMVEGRAGDASCASLAAFIAGELGESTSELRTRAAVALAAIPTTAARDALIRLLPRKGAHSRPGNGDVERIVEGALERWDDTTSRAALGREKPGTSFLTSLFAGRASG